jgi:hypothetical protein
MQTVEEKDASLPVDWREPNHTTYITAGDTDLYDSYIQNVELNTVPPLCFPYSLMRNQIIVRQRRHCVFVFRFSRSR